MGTLGFRSLGLFRVYGLGLPLMNPAHENSWVDTWTLFKFKATIYFRCRGFYLL